MAQAAATVRGTHIHSSNDPPYSAPVSPPTADRPFTRENARFLRDLLHSINNPPANVDQLSDVFDSQQSQSQQQPQQHQPQIIIIDDDDDDDIDQLQADIHVAQAIATEQLTNILNSTKIPLNLKRNFAIYFINLLKNYS